MSGLDTKQKLVIYLANKCQNAKSLSRGHKTIAMLSSAEHELLTAYVLYINNPNKLKFQVYIPKACNLPY